jgi:hypothetical protein
MLAALYYVFTSARAIQITQAGRNRLQDVPSRCLLGDAASLFRLLRTLKLV